MTNLNLKGKNTVRSPIKEGSYWFKRLKKECESISPYIRFKRIKFGFWRIYWRQAYIHEVYKDMPAKGYDLELVDPRLEGRRYYEEFEDRVEYTRMIKNYVEGYYDSIKKIRVRVQSMQNDKEAYKNARLAYKQMRIT